MNYLMEFVSTCLYGIFLESLEKSMENRLFNIH